MSKSWKAEVIADSDGRWTGNMLRFETQREAQQYASDLESRWMAVKKTRTVECDDAVSHRWNVDTQKAEALS